MLYAFCGDRYAAREKSRECISACLRKRPHAEYLRVFPGVEHHSLEELLLSQGLFERKLVVFCDEVVKDSYGKHLIDNLSEYQQSPHMFVIFEPSLSASDEKKLANAGAVVERYAEKSVEDSRALFSFSKLFFQGDGGRVFCAFHNLVRSDPPPAPALILHTLLWQFRMLVLVSQSGDAADAGVKPFVFSQTKTFLDNHNVGDPFSRFVHTEEIVRLGRLRGMNDADIVEYLILDFYF